MDYFVDKLYNLSAAQHLGLAVHLKEDPVWCKTNLGTTTTLVREAFEKVLRLRYSERLAVYRYYFQRPRWSRISSLQEYLDLVEVLHLAEKYGAPQENLISAKKAIRAFRKETKKGALNCA